MAFTKEQKEQLVAAIGRANISIVGVSDAQEEEVFKIQLNEKTNFDDPYSRIDLVSTDDRVLATSIVGLASMAIVLGTKNDLKKVKTTRDFRSAPKVFTLKEWAQNHLDDKSTPADFSFECIAKIPRVNNYVKGKVNANGKYEPEKRYMAFVYNGYGEYLAELAEAGDDQTKRFEIMRREMPKLLMSGISDESLKTKENIMYTPVFKPTKV
jgi:hypothetical protein